MLSLLKSVGHSRQLPSGRKIAQIMRAYWKEQAKEVTRLKRTAHVSLDHWNAPMVETLLPVIVGHWRAGYMEAEKRIAQKSFRKAIDEVERDLLDSFDVLNPAILDRLKTMTFQFAKSTNLTSAMRTEAAYAELRRVLSEGIERGEALKTLTGRVQEIYADPVRAQMVAATESSRALHDGQQEAAEEAGITQKRWLASSDACEICLELNGMVIGIGDNFAVDADGGFYADTPYPPRH